MGYKTILQILLILAIISTVCISIIKPKMHKSVMVYNSEFKIEHNDNVQIDESEIPVMIQNANVAQNEPALSISNQDNISISDNSSDMVSSNPVSFENTNIPVAKNSNFNNISNSGKNISFGNSPSVKNQPVNTVSNNIKVAKSNVSSQNTVVPQNSKIDLNKIVNNNKKIINDANKVEPSAVKVSQPEIKTPVKTYSQTQSKESTSSQPPIRLSSQTETKSQNVQSSTSAPVVVLTAAEEEIAWNKWRSNLYNHIMRDAGAKLPNMPNGIIFKYSFNVDKYGKITNVQTWSTTSGYTPYAIQYIAPVIRSYQGRTILNFPTGSNRVTTEVTGAWKISSNQKYSTESNFNDIEKVKR